MNNKSFQTSSKLVAREIKLSMEKTTKLSVIGLGLSVGLAWGLAVLAGGVLALIFSGWANVQEFTEFMNLIYSGWGMSFGQTLIMAIWAFSQGFVAGFLIAIFYNIFSKRLN